MYSATDGKRVSNCKGLASVQCKLDAINTYGGKIMMCEPTMDAREEACRHIQAETGAIFVPPYNDPLVISGQVHPEL